MNEVWLIERMWTDSMENRISAALGWEAVGYVTSQEEANRITSEQFIADGWPLERGKSYPKYRAKKLSAVSG